MKTDYQFSGPLPDQSATAPPLTPELAGPAPGQATSILVADKLPLFRRGLLDVLAQTFANCPVYEAATPHELLAIATHRRPTLVLLATNLARTPADMPAMLQQLRQQHEQVSIAVFIDPATGSELTSLRLLQPQINCLLTRAASPAQVCDSVRAVLQQGQHRECELPLPAPVALPQRRATGDFSVRQLQVLRLIAEDLSNEEIANCLCTSVRTVEYHRSQMLHKTGIRTTLGLVLFAQRQGLLPWPTTELPSRPQPGKRQYQH
ncbi:MAG: response regulator transcription factor [Janthinobacterium lividum]